MRAETLAFLAGHRRARVVQLTDRLVATIEASNPGYRATRLVPRADLWDSCHGNIGRVLELLATAVEGRATPDEADPLASVTTVRVDGEVRASFPTGDMLFGPYEYISAISRYITLSPGDVLWLGTDETATAVPGQVVEITIDGIGTLANPVTAESETFEEEP